MPTYEYRCEHGHAFEVMQKMSEEPIAECETCSAPVRRVLFPVAIHFKGKGFYSTDYGSRRRNRELKDAAEAGAKQEKSEGGSDSGSGNGSDSSKTSEGGSSSSSSDSSSSSSSSSESKSDKGEGKKKAGAAES